MTKVAHPYGLRLNDCSMKHYIVLNIAFFSHAHVTISAEIKLTHMRVRAVTCRTREQQHVDLYHTEILGLVAGRALIFAFCWDPS